MEIGGISLNLLPKVAGGFAFLPYAATLCGTQRTEIRRLEIAFRLLPLNKSNIWAFPCRLVLYTENGCGDTWRHMTAQK